MLQVLQDKHPEPRQVATTLEPLMAEGSTAVGYPLVVVMGEDLPQEGLMDHPLAEDPMDTPMLGDSPLELQEVLMVAQLQEVPMDSLLQIPMEPSILGLMDRALLQVALLPTWILRLTPGSRQWTPITVAISPSRN